MKLEKDVFNLIQTDPETRLMIAKLLIKLFRSWKIKLSDAKYILLIPQKQSLRALFDTDIPLLTGQIYIILDFIAIYKRLRSYHTADSQCSFMRRKMPLTYKKPQSIVEFWTSSRLPDRLDSVDLSVVSRVRAIKDFLQIHDGLWANESFPCNWQTILMNHEPQEGR